jgi:hypothetical protein
VLLFVGVVCWCCLLVVFVGVVANIAIVFLNCCSLFFLSALMMVAGPMDSCGDIGYTLTCGCFRKKSDRVAPNTSVIPMNNDIDARADKAWSDGAEAKDETQENWEI